MTPVRDLVPGGTPTYLRTMAQGVLDGTGGGLITIAWVTVMLGAVVGGVLNQHEIAAFLRRGLEHLRPPPETPAGPPIERIASDVRRLRAEFRAPAPGLPMARRVGISRAYDDLLSYACHALDVPDTLTVLPSGTERDAERLRVEHELEEAGLRLSA